MHAYTILSILSFCVNIELTKFSMLSLGAKIGLLCSPIFAIKLSIENFVSSMSTQQLRIESIVYARISPK